MQSVRTQRNPDGAMQVKRILGWTLAVLLAAAAVGLVHGLLAIANPLLGSVYFDLLFQSAFVVALAHAAIIGVPARPPDHVDG